jgi:hypothetical protein
MRLFTLLFVLGAFYGRDGLAQAPAARLVEVRAEPEEPPFGEAFKVHVTLRLPAGAILFFPDTALPAEATQSAGRGAWSEVPAPADSVEIRATYPVIGFREGRVDLPGLEFWIRPAAPGERKGKSAVRRAAGSETGPGSGLQRRLIRLGRITIQPFAPMADGSGTYAPRQPADVLGGDRSLWQLLAMGVIALIGVLAGGIIFRRWWAARGAALVAQLRGQSPRQEALRELERIRALGWHRNGRMDDFYASSTGALRRFAATTDPLWGDSLTSTELLSRLSERWGPARVASLATTVAVAERVKFGAFKPDAEAAEGDWGTIFEWIRDAPER